MALDVTVIDAVTSTYDKWPRIGNVVLSLVHLVQLLPRHLTPHHVFDVGSELLRHILQLW